MVNGLETGSTAPGSNSGQGLCVVFLRRTLTHAMPVYKCVPAS